MFKGKKIRLRAYQSNEIDKVFELITEEGLLDTLFPTTIFPLSYEAQKSFIDNNLVNSSELFNFAIESLETNEYIGGCGISKLDRKNSVATIGMEKSI